MKFFVLIFLLFAMTEVSLSHDVTVLSDEASFPEGPEVRDGVLYFAEYGSDKVSTIDEAGAVQTFWEEEGCGPSAIAELDDAFLVTCYDNGKLALVDDDGETMGVHKINDAGLALVGPNDIAVHENGAFVTTSGPWESEPIVGTILWLEPGKAPRLLADDLHYANGIAVSPQDGRLYVAESEAGRIISFEINEDKSLSDRRLFVRLTELGESQDAYPDGIKFGPDGKLYIGQFSSSRILVVDQNGKKAGSISVPSAAAPNLAFSADGKTAFVMAVDDPENPPYPGKVYAVRLE